MSNSFSLVIDIQNAAALRALQATRNQFRDLGRVGGAAFRGMTAPIRGSITLMHELNGAVQLVKGAFDKLSGPVKLAANMQAAQARFRVLVGDVGKANDLFRQLQTLADDNPILGMTEVMEAAAGLASTSLEKSKIPQFLRNLGEAATDAEKFGRMALAATQVLAKGGKVQGEELLQFAEAGLPVIEEMARVLGVTGDEFSKMQAKGQVTFATLEQAVTNLTTGTGAFAGASGAAADTLSGKWTAFEAVWERLQRAIGAPINDALTPILNAVNVQMEGMEGAATRIGEALRYGIDFSVVTVQAGMVGDALKLQMKIAGMELLNWMINGATKFLVTLVAGFDAFFAWIEANLLRAVAAVVDMLPDALVPDSMAASKAREDADALERDGLVDFHSKQLGGDGGFKKGLEDLYSDQSGMFDSDINELKAQQALMLRSLNKKTEKRQEMQEEENAAAEEALDAKKKQAKRDADIEAMYDKMFKRKGWDAPATPYSADPEARGQEVEAMYAKMFAERGWDGSGPATLTAPGAGEMPGAVGGGVPVVAGGAGGGVASAGRRAGGAAVAGKKAVPGWSRTAQGLINRFARQAAGSGRQSWGEVLSSEVATSGISRGEMSRLRGLSGGQIADVATNRRNRTAAAREEQGREGAAAKSDSVAEMLLREVPAIRESQKSVEEKLTKVQVR